MSSLVSFSYFDNKKIVIPQIQRDYAEGRMVGRVPEIRHSLLTEMIDVVSGNKQQTELDFVYGYERNGCFEPLDGQQRLTTLFLLQWVLAGNVRKMKVGDEPRLTYVNRESSNDFCKELVKHSSNKVFEDYENKLVKYKEPAEFTLIQYFKECGWYRWNWNFDSTIQSMLVVVNDIYGMLKKRNYDYQNTSAFLANFENIKFRFLNLNDFMMGDELYIKMNARGKELSSFDLLKSFLEHDLSSQVDQNIRNSWQTNIDCAWMDYLWWKYYTNAPQNERSVELIESKYESILHILIWYQIISESNNLFSGKKDKKEIANQQMGNIINVYKGLRSVFEIDYELLIKHFNSLFCKTNGNFDDLDTSTNLFGGSLLTNCIDNAKYDDLIFLYAYIVWVTRIDDLHTILNNQTDKDNYYTFMRFIKNIYELDNAGTSRIDSPTDFYNAMKWIVEMVDSFKATNVSFREYINDHISHRTGIQVLEESIEEEKIKAGLILQDPNWKAQIEFAENNTYLKGQIYSLLYVEKNDIDRFHNLADKFNKMFDGLNDTENGLRLLQLLMIDRPYNTVADGSNKGTLIEINQHRDYSLKQHLRKSDCCILNSFKAIMDLWLDPTYDSYDFIHFYNEFKRVKQNEISGLPYWRQFIINNSKWYESIPEINKHFISIEDAGFLYIKKSMVREELLICYLHGIVKLNNDITLIDDNNDEKTICFMHNNIKYKVFSQLPNNYVLEVNDTAINNNIGLDALLNELNNRCGINVF